PLRQMNVNISGAEDNYTPRIIGLREVKGMHQEMPVVIAQDKRARLYASSFDQNTKTIRDIDLSRNHAETMLTHYGGLVQLQGYEGSIQGQGMQRCEPK
ncbi:3-phosphoshikimate 1-carboxyvinyltransferase, partial [Staphylococcus pseudintermedius]